MTQDWLRFRLDDVRSEIELLKAQINSSKATLEDKTKRLDMFEEVYDFLLKNFEGDYP